MRFLNRHETAGRSNPASRFKAVRQSHRVEAAEDYTEMIADLIKEQGEARLCSLAKKLGISHVTALRTLRRLEEEGYLITTPYAPITLTSKGQKLANKSKKRHEIVLSFLIKIGVPGNLAKIDAEGIEHHISDKTLKIIKNFIARSE